jgi:hypothetical protein
MKIIRRTTLINKIQNDFVKIEDEAKESFE